MRDGETTAGEGTSSVTSTRRAASRIVGVISDTHGLLRPEAVAALSGARLIIHAGDIGNHEILDELRHIAQVVAVRGNSDKGAWAKALPNHEVVQVGGLHLYVLHDVQELDLDPVAAGFKAVIAGHSHRSSIRRKDGVLYLNPGSAGPRRFNLPVTLARLYIRNGNLDAEIVVLEV